MTRLARHTLNALVVLSLLLCVATAVLWVRSYDRAEEIGWYTLQNTPAQLHHNFFGIIATDGDLRFCFERSLTDVGPQPLRIPLAPGGALPAGFTHLRLQNDRVRDREAIHVFGFSFKFARASNIPGMTVAERWIQMPAWFVAILAAWPAIRLTKRLRRRQIAGRCPTCGYDLRATPTRCPECGTIPANVTR